jgi:hypothetical protein
MKRDTDGKSQSIDEVIDYQTGAAYAPNARRWTEIQIPPGVNPDSLVVYAGIDGQD